MKIGYADQGVFYIFILFSLFTCGTTFYELRAKTNWIRGNWRVCVCVWFGHFPNKIASQKRQEKLNCASFGHIFAYFAEVVILLRDA